MLDLQETAHRAKISFDELQHLSDELLILYLFQQGKLSSTDSSQLLHISPDAFHTLCFDYGVPTIDPVQDSS